MILRDYEADDIDDDDKEWGDDPDHDVTDDCPGCGASIYDDSERCPRCGRYLSREDTPTRKPWWVILGSLTCLAMVTWWILHP